ncbi:hypothetical protein PVAND_007492 [Polypedilum vanderplanki]|uniref:Chitin-binding type-2 domain-containing protein n=1 Tax=Polypedilum vanderplanki TaxID=319348 RepID=A0A9J6C6P5_POLVA|nr:hypothetical protein PVAND_007492 [Polypedilum vanderplanki]
MKALIIIILINSFQLIFCNDINFLMRYFVSKEPHFPSIDINEICNGAFFEARPFPGNSNFFVGCIRGNGIILQCHPNELFDENQLKCVTIDEINTTTTIITTTTTVSTEPPNYNDLCEGLFFDFIEHPNDCGKAIFCYEEQAIVRECSLGTIFDKIIQECRPGNRVTCEFYDIPPTTTNVPIETSTAPDLTDICNGVDLGFIEHPSDCGKAIFCFNQQKVLRECPENHIFDIQLGICRLGNRDTCEFQEMPPDGNIPVETTTSLNLDGICYGKEFKFIEHPTDCGKAIFCFNQNPIFRECPENQIFDISIEDCRDGNRETCLFYSRQNMNEHQNLCKRLDDVLIPHEIDLTKFYRCAAGRAYDMRCDFNEVFDIEKEMKIKMKNFQVVILFTILFNVFEIKAQNVCSGVWAGRVWNANDCSKYYTCVLTIPIEGSCDAYEIFNPATLNCIPGDPSTCKPFDSTTIATTFSPLPDNTTTTFIPTNTTFSTSISYNTTTTTMRTTTSPPNINDICKNVFFGARPFPDSDTLYVGCIRGNGVIQECFVKEIFDKTINECIEHCEVSENICIGIKLNIIENPCDCTRYIVCFNEAMLDDGECGPNEIFSPNDREYRPGNQETCELYSENTATITEPTFPITSTTTSIPIFNPCSSIEIGRVPHETDCTMYYSCLNYQYALNQCPPNQFFNETMNHCQVGSC